jgi:phosphoglycerol transferase MdoB-like AlkP superfamily enzyme
MPVRFFALVLTGLALIAPGAHLFEMFRKMRLSQGDYFIVQGIYQGWWIAGLLLPAALIANLALMFSVRVDRPAFFLAMAAAGLIALNLAIFVIWTQPANAVTQNWTLQPENWQALRTQWEYSHAVNAAVTLLAFGCATLAALRRGVT